MPENDGTTAWFNAIWNTEWNTRYGTVPSYWSTILTPTQVAAWNGDANGSNLYRLRVIRIVLPRYVISISNTHPTANGYVYYNESVSPLLTSGRQLRRHRLVRDPGRPGREDFQGSGDRDRDADQPVHVEGEYRHPDSEFAVEAA